jgi:hypothetical protein
MAGDGSQSKESGLKSTMEGSQSNGPSVKTSWSKPMPLPTVTM